MADITWTDEAQLDFEAALRYIARDAPRAANLLGERVRNAVARVAAFPLSGRIVPELGAYNVREVFISPYRLIYRVSQVEIEILLFHHGARLLGRSDFPSDL